MAPRRCCVLSCTAIQGEGVPLHGFPDPSKPDEIERFRTWVMRIGGDIFKYRRIRHRHLEERYTFPNQRLTKLAIPSLHLPGLPVSSRPILMYQNVPEIPNEQAASIEALRAQPSTSRAQPSASRAPIHGPKVQLRSKPMSKAERELRGTLASTSVSF